MLGNFITGGTFTTNSGVIATSGAATTYNIGTAIDFCIRGKAYNKGTVTGGTTPTTDKADGLAFTALAASKGCVFLWTLNASGTVAVYQGAIEDIDSASLFVKAPEFPTFAATECPFAYTVCINGSTGSSWTFGSSNWNATGMTATSVDIMMLPDRPQES